MRNASICGAALSPPQVQHRDNEIGILVSMLKKLHGGVKDGAMPLPTLGGGAAALMAEARGATAAADSISPAGRPGGAGPASSAATASVASSRETLPGGPAKQAWGGALPSPMTLHTNHSLSLPRLSPSSVRTSS